MPVPPHDLSHRISGGPGSGKGTQCERLLEESGAGAKASVALPKLYHLNIGGLLRAELARYESALKAGAADADPQGFGPVLQTQLSTGKILPSWVTLTIIRKELERITQVEARGAPAGGARARQPSAGAAAIPVTQRAAILIDGFPRSVENFTEWERLILPATRLVVVSCTEDAMIARVLRRGAAAGGRADDQDVATVRKRIAVFNGETGDVIAHFASTPLAGGSQASADAAALETSKRAAQQQQQQQRTEAATGERRRVVWVDGNRPADDVYQDFRKAFVQLVGL